MGKIAINIATGSLQKEDIIAGIDLGTTNSLIAVVHPETKLPVVLREHDNSSSVPSVVHFNTNGTIAVGESATPFLSSDPANTIYSVKRLIGKNENNLSEINERFPFKITGLPGDSHLKIRAGEKEYSPAEISSFILKELKKRAEHILKTPVTRAVITVPAYFDDEQRHVTREAGSMAGFDVLRIINEPTAASLAYGLGLQKDENKTIAVYDLGGGTFDISILRISAGIFEVLSTNGNTFLGGDDMDAAVVRHWGEKLLNNPEARLVAESAKKVLSERIEFETILSGIKLTLTRNQFEALIDPLVSTTLVSCKNALKDSGLSKSDIDEVIMVGGSTRVPYVKQKVAEFFGRPVNDSVNPDEAVALGAAVQADILAGNNKETLLLDITPLSLGIETAGELMDVLIPRNAKIPASAAREYTTQTDAQTGMNISVFQGERDIVSDNRKLASFVLKGIPVMPAGMAKVRVSFLVNADGILTVKAKELRSGIEQTIEVKPQEGIADSDVEKMLLDSMTNAEADIAIRALAEATTEAEQLLKTTERFLQKNADLLEGEELTHTAAAMQSLQLATTLKNKKLIQEKIEELNNISRPYAERIMNSAVSRAMKGTNI